VSDLEKNYPADQPLSYEAFVSYLAAELNIELPDPPGDLIIGVDLELDSISMLELVVAIEDLGAELPADLFLTAKSVAEVYGKYLSAAGAGGDDAAPHRLEGA
jgi:acyl carrier protein